MIKKLLLLSMVYSVSLASYTWNPPVKISEGEYLSVGGLDLGSNTAGKFIAIWSDMSFTEIPVSTSNDGINWSMPPVNICSLKDIGEHVQVAIGPTGDILAIFYDAATQVLIGRYKPASSSWQNPVILSESNIIEPEFFLVVNDSGQFLLITNLLNGVQARFFSNSTGWQSPEMIYGYLEENAVYRIKCNGANHWLVVLSDPSIGTVGIWNLDGLGWQTPVNISTLSALDSDFDFDSNGNAHVIWVDFLNISSTVFYENGLVDAPQPITSSDGIGEVAIRLDLSNQAIAIWSNNITFTMESASQAFMDAWSPPTVISLINAFFSGLVAGKDEDGNVLVAWKNNTIQQIESVELPQGGTFTLPKGISPINQSIDFLHLTVTKNAGAVASWFNTTEIGLQTTFAAKN